MRRLLVSIAAALSLLVGYHVTPASAHYLPPGGLTIDNANGCWVISTYGTYGNGFAQVQMSAGTCVPSMAVEVTTAHAGHTHVRYCDLYEAVWQPSSGCYLVEGSDPFVIRAVAPGDAFLMRAFPCGPDYCGTFRHGLLE